MTEKYWEEEIETMSRADLEKLQLERLKKTVACRPTTVTTSRTENPA